MRKAPVVLNLLLAMFLFSTAFAQYPQPQYVGIPSAEMNYFAAAQKNSQWCWAASIQMVLNYYGVAILQEQIVARTYGTDPYGRLPDKPGGFQEITANLNNWSIDNRGQLYTVSASMYAGVPTPTILIQELRQKRPIIVGYRSGPKSAHAVVITAASFIPSLQGPIIVSVVVRDPWPSKENIFNSGRVEYPRNYLASLMQTYWYIRVSR